VIPFGHVALCEQKWILRQYNYDDVEIILVHHRGTTNTMWSDGAQKLSRSKIVFL